MQPQRLRLENEPAGLLPVSAVLRAATLGGGKRGHHHHHDDYATDFESSWDVPQHVFDVSLFRQCLRTTSGISVSSSWWFWSPILQGRIDTVVGI